LLGHCSNGFGGNLDAIKLPTDIPLYGVGKYSNQKGKGMSRGKTAKIGLERKVEEDQREKQEANTHDSILMYNFMTMSILLLEL
jgi:hypothetical protein